MDEQTPNKADVQMDELLSWLGRRGILDTELSDDFEEVMENAPSVLLSTNFAERAIAAMTKAQNEREQRNPAIAFGASIARSRRGAGVALRDLGANLGIAEGTFETLEAGQLSVRQIMAVLPSSIAARFLAQIKFSIEEFSNLLLDLAASGGMPYATAKVTRRESKTDSGALLMDVMEYIKAVETSVRSG